jgi:signal transduction histidine kinase/ActR/RegA family two-component response regulator
MAHLEEVLYLVAAVLQLAAMFFAVRMAREVNDRRPWLVLFLALFIMFAFRVVAMFVAAPTRQHFGPYLSVPISSLLLLSLFYIRKVALAERESRLAADQRRIELEQAAEQRSQLLASERAARSSAEHASRMKDEFLATLSHELRTPLNAILGWSQLLRQGARDEDDLEQGLATIERNARVQTHLIEDLLDMSRIISGKLRLDLQRTMPATFMDAAIEAIQPAAAAKGVRLEKMLDPNAGPVAADANRMQQVVWNLLSNAIKFTPKGGKVQVLLERVNSHIEITVADTGEGIEADFLPYLFDRFRQSDASTSRRHGGLGIGLAIVKQLVELHGGSVRATSGGLGRGATLVVHLPITVVQICPDDPARVHPTLPSKDSHHASVSLAGLKVLVVDDELDARNLMKRVLEESKAHVLTASSCEEAMPLIAADRPHVLVSDIGMADIDGYEFLRRVRALEPDMGGRTPAIALTAFARSEDRTRALMAGYQVHVAKPVEPTELVASVASVAGRTV